MGLIRVGNFSACAYDGWLRRNVDGPVPFPAGEVNGVRWVAGPPSGEDTTAIDFRVRLAPGEVKAFDLVDSRPQDFSPLALPADPVSTFGPSPTIAGQPLSLLECVRDGAGYRIHMLGRVAKMLVAHVWLQWYPDTPFMAQGEVLFVASDPSVRDLYAIVPADCRLIWGKAWCYVPGQRDRDLLPAGQLIADGQGRAFPIVLFWTQLMADQADFATSGAAAQFGVVGNGISRLWPGGNPRMPPKVAVSWERANYQAAFDALHGWGNGGLGPNPKSGDPGAQEDQVFVGGEFSSLGSEFLRYLVALGMARRPCHHLEANGQLLQPSLHPDLLLWDGRPHAGSRDQLGKPAPLTYDAGLTHGWWGPDVEHWLLDSLYVAARVYGTPALQWLLRAQANVALLQFTVPGYTFATRAVGWEALGATLLHSGLQDRFLAQEVATHWGRRFATIIRPEYSAAALDIWDPRLDDPRLGTGKRWMPWQQAVAAYGLHVAGERFQVPAARELALRGAKRVLESGWVRVASTGRYSSAYAPLADESTPVPDGGMDEFGMPLAPAVVLLNDPAHARARAIWAQLQNDTGGTCTWFPPEVR